MYIIVSDGVFGLIAIVNAVSTLIKFVVPVETLLTNTAVGMARLHDSSSTPLHHEYDFNALSTNDQTHDLELKQTYL